MTNTLRTDVLEIAYERWDGAERSTGAPVVLVHGFPDSPASWAPVATALTERGRQAIAPYLRGFGPTRFLSDSFERSGQLAAIVQDLTDLLDGLALDEIVLVGQDWGARAAQGVAATQPDRVASLVCVGGYALSWNVGDGPPSYSQVQALWYQFFLRSGWGEGVLHADPIAFCEHLWRIWSPAWPDRARVFGESRAALGGEEFARIVLSAYRDDPTDDRYRDLETWLGKGPEISVPTTLLHGADDPLEADGPDVVADAKMFTELRDQRIIDGAGHFLHAERPDVLVDAIEGSR